LDDVTSSFVIGLLQLLTDFISSAGFCCFVLYLLLNFQKDARVLAYDKTHMVMVASKPSPNQLLSKGFGVLKVSRQHFLFLSVRRIFIQGKPYPLIGEMSNSLNETESNSTQLTQLHL